MKRRAVLTSSIVMGTLGGCVGLFTGSSKKANQPTHTVEPSPSPPNNKAARTRPYVVRRDFTLLDKYPKKEFNHDEKQIRNAAHIEVNSQTNHVVVIGLIKSGQRSCMRTFLQKAAYTHQKDTLDIIIHDKVTDPNGPCSSEVAVVPYKLVVGFENGLPKSITVTYNSDLQKSNFTKTVRR